ncbi:hypothetical protein JCM8208_003856 [Rhodotorula glutinis]
MAHARPPPLHLSHAPTISSRLAPPPSSSSPLGPTQHPSSDSQLPSSPTTSSFYRPSSSLSRPPPGRAYKSTSSARRSLGGGTGSGPHGPTSSPSGPSASLRAAQENARRARARPRALAAGEGGPDGPGGWGADGEWEEWDADELARLDAEVRKERRRWEWDMREREERARDEGRIVDPDLEDPSVEDDDMRGEEPPDDVLYDSEPLPSPALYPPQSRRLPSLTSAPGSSASSANGYLSDPDLELEPDPDPDLDLDLDMDLSSPPTNDLAAFSAALLAAPCPACAATPVSPTPTAPLSLDETHGLACRACGWNIPVEVLEPLAGAFTSHGSTAAGHAPILSWTRFTRTIVFCAERGCDEQFAA